MFYLFHSPDGYGYRKLGGRCVNKMFDMGPFQLNGD